MDEVVRDYLKCGDLAEGFARIRCTNPGCGSEYLLAFSCKGRWFCPSCHSKKVVQFGEDVCNNILYPVPHRQFVFSIPILLEYWGRPAIPVIRAIRAIRRVTGLEKKPANRVEHYKKYVVIFYVVIILNLVI